MSGESVSNALGTEKVGKLIVQFSVPSVIALVVVAFYNIVDQIFIGQAVGYLANAATNVILPFTTTVIAFGNMLSDGTAANMSLQLGSGDKKLASRGVGNCITLMIIFGIAACVLFEIFLRPLCWLFGATDNTIGYALAYGRIIVIGFPFSMIDGALTSVIRADGRPKQSMCGMLMGCGINIVLDALFCLGFGWGVEGAALATVIGQLIVTIYYICLLFHMRSVRMERGFLKLKADIVKRILTLGFSSFITQISIVLTIFVMNNVIVKVGAKSMYGSDIPLAVIGITMKFCTIATSIALGIASGTQPVWGFNYGSGRHDRVKAAYKIALAASFIVLIIAFVIFEAFPAQLISLFGTESDLYMEFAIKCIRHYLAGTFMIGATQTTCIFFQSLGRPVQATFVTFLRQVITLIPAILILGFVFGIDGLIWAGALSDGLSGVIALVMVAASWKKLFSGK